MNSNINHQTNIPFHMWIKQKFSLVVKVKMVEILVVAPILVASPTLAGLTGRQLKLTRVFLGENR